jgi:hypothetical protein
MIAEPNRLFWLFGFVVSGKAVFFASGRGLKEVEGQ